MSARLLAVGPVATETCAYCGRESDGLHRDHVVPRSRGGPDNATNIVLACQPCNSSKRDKLASEWLGDECPERVLRIEQQVNRRLESHFKKRDYKKKRLEPPVKKCESFVFHIQPDGGVDYIGDLLEEKESCFRVEVLDAFMATACGMWELSGEIRDLPKEQCRMFNDRMVCLETALRINQEKYAKRAQ